MDRDNGISDKIRNDVEIAWSYLGKNINKACMNNGTFDRSFEALCVKTSERICQKTTKTKAIKGANHEQ